MEDIKTFLIYLVGLVGLIGASLLFANQGEPPELSPLPATAAPTDRIAQLATRSAAVSRAECTDTAQGMIFDDVPGMSSAITNSDDGRLFISGTIYASDGATPLPGALIKVGQGMPIDEYQSYLHRTQLQTEASGRYTFTMENPRPGYPISLHYRVSYQNRCLLSMHLKIITVSLLRPPLVRDSDPSFPVSAQSPVAQFSEVGPVFHGPIDIVLPVPPPVP
jgi:hypothetical protein